MNYYTQKILRLKKGYFSNEEQLKITINTKRHIDTHFDQELNLEELAQLQQVSKFHLIRMFKKYYGLTPRQYLIDKRIENARKILRSGKSVSDACYSVGYDSVHSFSTLFKAKSGMSPSDYRRATFDKARD